MSETKFGRRDFIRLTAIGGSSWAFEDARCATAKEAEQTQDCLSADPKLESRGRVVDGMYAGEQLARVAFPLGGIGAGMICLEGAGALSHVSVRHKPDLRHEPSLFAAVSMIDGKRRVARVLEGPVPQWKIAPDSSRWSGTYGLPRFANATFRAYFPFAEIELNDKTLPLDIQIVGWSPFEPGRADDSSLPVAALEYGFTNGSSNSVEAVFSFNAANFMSPPTLGAGDSGQGVQAGSVRPVAGGFCLHGSGSPARPWDEGDFAIWTDDETVKVNHAWFRGTWSDGMTMAWHDVEAGACYTRDAIEKGEPSPGASLFVPITLAPGERKRIIIRMAWYVPYSNLRWSGGGRIAKLVQDGSDPSKERYRPWYAGRFGNSSELIAYWNSRYGELRTSATRFRDCFFSSSLPPDVLEAVSANLTILKSPTVLRQTDGRLWGWEGCSESEGSCPGSCTHVWNYAQAIPHLFPDLERTMRETEFHESLSAEGHQNFRTALPIRSADQDHSGIAAADGQLGGIIKIYRDWRISGDTNWLRELWPKIRSSLDFSIRTWDPRGRGWLEEVQHNAYDMALWGPNGMCTSIYLSALSAAVKMGDALGADTHRYAKLFKAGKARAEAELFNDEYFIQRIQWTGLNARFPEDAQEDGIMPPYTPEALALAAKQGPKYQYGDGCLSDGVIGSWFALVSGLDDPLDPKKVRSHLRAVHKYNLKHDLAEHVNLMRSSFAQGHEGGVVVCTWPHGKLSLPGIYSGEVFTGIEYQVASHLIAYGDVDKGLEIVRICRSRYDGRIRNPFDEVEAGHWYARAMSSYALLAALSGARYDAVDKVLYLKPAIKGDFRCFLSTASGYGTVGVRNRQPFVEVVAGEIPYVEIKYTPAS